MSDTNEMQVVINKIEGIEPSKAEVLLSKFSTYYNAARVIAAGANDIVVKDENDKDGMATARQARLGLKEIRVNTEKTRRELKENSLRESRAIDGIANVIKALIEPVEEALEKKEKYAEELAKAKLDKVEAERREKMLQYVDDVSFYNLREMSDEGFEKLLASSKAAHDAQVAAEAKAEAERVEERRKDELESKRKLELAPYTDYSKLTVNLRELPDEEYALLLSAVKIKKMEDDAEQKRIRDERDKLIQQQEVEKKSREEAEAKLRAEKEAVEKKLRDEKEAQAKKEREERERMEKEAREEEDRKRQAILAPDKIKLVDLAALIRKIEMPAVSSNEASGVIRATKDMLAKVCVFIESKAETL